jgi:hypothetical protein
LQESANVPKLKPQATSVLEGDESIFQQQKSDPNKIIKLPEEKLDQLDLQITLKQSTKVAAKNIQQTCSSLDRICLVHPETFFSILILKLRGTKLDETWTQWSPQDMECIPKRSFSQIQRFPFRFWRNSKNLGFGDELTKSSNRMY